MSSIGAGPPERNRAPGEPGPGLPLLYIGCNCTATEPGLLVYRCGGSCTFDGCQGSGGTMTGYLGVMGEPRCYAHATIAGFICEL
jgi:hypothetical protein